MLVPIALIVIVLIAAIAGALYAARQRMLYGKRQVPDLRPDDRLPTADPDLTNPPIGPVGVSGRPWPHTGAPPR